MEEMRLGAIESKFADIVWKNEPMTTRELVSVCEKELSWNVTSKERRSMEFHYQ